MTLDHLRNKIDAINIELIGLFAERLDVTKQVAALKKQQNLPVLDAQREELQREALRAFAKAKGLSPAIIEEIFILFIEYSRLEMKMEMDKR